MLTPMLIGFILKCLTLALGKMHYYQNSDPVLTLTGRTDAGTVNKKDATNTDAPSRLTKLDLIKMSWPDEKKIIKVQILT